MAGRKKTALCLNSAFFGYYAHAGFMQGISGVLKPQIVTGCSSGAMIGALYCAGVDINEIVNLMLSLKRKDFWEGNVITQFIKPFTRGISRYSGLLSGKKIRTLLRPYLGDLSFDKLKIPLGVAVSNVTTGARELRTSGNVLESVMCSMAFPLLIEVQKMDGHEFIDGGVVDHEPTKELILDPDIGEIVIHSIDTTQTRSKSPILRSFQSSVSIIEKETRDLKERLASHHKTKITRVITNSPEMGPDKIHMGPIALQAGRESGEALKKKGKRIKGV